MLLPDVDTVPEVPDDIHPADTVGAMVLLPLYAAVTNPVSLIVIVGFAVMVVLGVVALPLATVTRP